MPLNRRGIGLSHLAVPTGHSILGEIRISMTIVYVPVIFLQGFLTQCESRIIVTGKLNHEVDALHTIVVRVTDEHGLFAVQKFTVKILDINDSPHVSKPSYGSTQYQ